MKTTNWEKVFITPQKFHDDVIKLCSLIPKNKYRYVYGIPRGGWAVAVYVSHYCNLDLIICDDVIHSSISFVKDTILVDDLADTGATLEKGKEYDSAVIYYKPRSVIKPTYYVEEIKNTDWIVFPFEKENEEPNREVS